jgi:hypothetical protein
MTITDLPPPNYDPCPRPERSVVRDRLCDACCGILTGRRPQARFRSDRCRMRYRREDARRNLEALFETAERALAELRREVLS